MIYLLLCDPFKFGTVTIYENERKSGKHIKDAEHLAEELQKYPCLYEKGNKGYEEIDQKENAWRAVKQFQIVFL